MIGILLSSFAAMAILFLFFWKYWFLRNPDRDIPEGRRFLSPADGRVIEIIATDNRTSIPSFHSKKNCENITQRGYRITVYLSLFDVHYQRAPVDGQVVSLHYVPGHFFPAFSPKARRNERNEILFDNQELGGIKLIQVAGILARRIKCFVIEGENITKGQVIGVIRFGSRVIFSIPALDLKIRKGQRVKAGQTVIAEYR